MQTGAARSGRAALADAGSPPHRGGMLFYPPAVPGACKTTPTRLAVARMQRGMSQCQNRLTQPPAGVK
jgi:hypothetical protein